MSIFKCKMCGGNIDVTDGVTVVECEYCGTKQTVPDVNDEKKLNLYNRANRLRMNSEFDKAGAIYEQIIAEFPEEAEAYWGLCLCNYGIEYVDDPATGAKIPTVHRASFEKLRKDENYELALEYADLGARVVYQEQAKEIDRIMGEILSISSIEKPYDIFICYKETDTSGSRTPDSVIAQDIYDELTKKGYKVFFSRITLEDKLGQQYEPYIFAALNSAKLMLAIGTDYEYYNAVWVKNEWSRFLKLMAKDKSKMLIPCFKDMDAYDMPNEFKGLQSQDMGKLGFMQDLLRGIDKIFGKEKTAAEEHSTVIVKENGGNPSVDSLLERVFMFLEDGKFKDANEYCERVLDLEPKCARAYLGKLMAALGVRTPNTLKDAKLPLDGNEDFAKVCRFDSELAAKLKADNEYIRKRNETARKQGVYDKAAQAAAAAKSDKQFIAAAVEFESIGGFKDADARAADCRKKAKAFALKVDSVAAALKKVPGKDEQQILETQLDELQRLFDGFDAATERLNALKAQASALQAECDELTKKIASLGLFKIKEKSELSAKLSQAKAKLDDVKKEGAEIVSRCGKFDSKEKLAASIREKQTELANIERKNSGAAGYSFAEAKCLCESDEQLRAAIVNKYPELSMILAKAGSFVTFGSYPQTADGTKKPIEWLVLEKAGNQALIISRYGLDCKLYNEPRTDITWERCTLRKWLNGEFLNTTFTPAQQAAIVLSNVTAYCNPNYSPRAGNATKDKIFLLSIPEAARYFISDESRKCASTAYAKARGTGTDGTGLCWWWLRSPGYDQDYAAAVGTDGSVTCSGYTVNYLNVAVRPALRINLE